MRQAQIKQVCGAAAQWLELEPELPSSVKSVWEWGSVSSQCLQTRCCFNSDVMSGVVWVWWSTGTGTGSGGKAVSNSTLVCVH